MSDAPPPQTDRLIGTLAGGKYRILSLIAAGGMGKIYRAEQQPLGRIVALKLLHVAPAGAQGSSGSGNTSDAEVSAKRFFREASILAKLQHPNIVTVYDFGTVELTESESGDNRRFFMAMEFLDGETLHARMLQQKQLSWEETVRFGRQISRGLREAHALGIVHRDLKPMNLMITTDRDGEDLIKILDFGIVKMADGVDPASVDEARKELTQEGAFVGSPMYMAPEQIEGGKVDHRADIYSLGVVLYRCLTGTVPFHSGGTMKIMMAHLSDEPPPIAERARDVPAWLDQLVHQCLRKAPKDRPQSMEELLRALSDPRGGSSSTITLDRASRVAPPPPPASFGVPPLAPIVEAPTISGGAASSMRPAPPTRKKRVWLPFAAIALLLGSIALAVVAIRTIANHKDDAAPRGDSSSGSATAASTFKLTLDSDPGGADVTEDGVSLGTTPITLVLDAAQLRKAKRTFTLRREGYLPYAVVQGPSDESVRVVAALVAVPAAIHPPALPDASASVSATASTSVAAATTAPKFVPKPPPVAVSTTASKPAPPESTLDIKLKR